MFLSWIIKNEIPWTQLLPLPDVFNLYFFSSDVFGLHGKTPVWGGTTGVASPGRMLEASPRSNRVNSSFPQPHSPFLDTAEWEKTEKSGGKLSLEETEG